MIKLYRSSAAQAHDLIPLAAKELCGVSDAKVLRTDKGKPYFADLDICFSLSHSGDRAILAVSKKEIGADIQIMRPISSGVARRFFTENEQAYIAAACSEEEKLRRFYEVWTKKEAYGKALGGGLSDSLKCDVTKLDFYTECDGEYMISVYEK
ncbi:MAG: 4'-phosphopantetheinyl transferase superfamily protein [Clostridia bacterium]|nr:4'-phosphopantetheinyl transferase superfamily protein [Clostridia bacterium]